MSEIENIIEVIPGASGEVVTAGLREEINHGGGHPWLDRRR
ncbi:MAG TPA: hypothetical protein VM557_01555 [Thermoanaerobaculia bacterium]|nr:hypothetical protein [Thermoanaerobaculia bacterium]